MLAEIGLTGVFVAFIAALYAMAAATYGGRRHSEGLILSARNAALVTFPLLLLSTVALLAALITEQYQISYVWSVTDPQTPLIYRITALWGSQEGSLLFWTLTMSLFAFAALLVNWHSHRRLMPGVIFYTMAVTACFIGLVLFLENPFTRFWATPDLTVGASIPDYALIPAGAIMPPAQLLAETSKGLNPLLRHLGMIIHPPMLYLGFVGFVIPFAFAMSALASGDLSTNWIKATRRWSLIAWIFLSLGLILGGRWAYDVLGWGGYWGWDPVENAAFIPWLVGTAFIHSVMIQEKRGMLKVWNMFLVIGTFSSVMFATFATRSGLIESVHSFARSEIGTPMFVLWAALTVISVALLLWRWNRGDLRDEHRFSSWLSREALFVLNNVVFVALALVIFWGSFGAPILSELFFDTNITLGREYFETVTPPLFVAMYILMGVAPLSAWGVTSLRRMGRSMIVPFVLALAFGALMIVAGLWSPVALAAYVIVAFAAAVALYEIYRGARARAQAHGEPLPAATVNVFVRNRRRYGGYLVHLGITVIGIGVIGSTLFQARTEQTLRPGESVVLQDYTLRFDRATEALAEDGREMTIVDVTVFRGGEQVAQLRPRIDHFPAMPMTIAAAHSTLENDFYVLLTGYDPASGIAQLWVYINPLVNLVWWGAIVLIIGTLVSVWPNEPAAARARAASGLQGAGA